MTSSFRVAGLALATWLGFSAPAFACLSCGCGGSGVSADLGGGGGTASLFSMGNHWLMQEGTNVRSITGSFNERGGWNPAPAGGSITSVSTSLGLNYFPSMDTSLTLQVPMVANRLSNATWGPLGSINPTDTGTTSGGALGDVAVQGTHKLYEAGNFALSGWGGLTAPTGNVDGDPSGFTGGGVWSGEAGIVGLVQLGAVELTANLGYEQPFGVPPVTATSFYIGQALLYQAAANYSFNQSLRAGIGLSGYAGMGRFGTGDLAEPLAKLEIMPNVQYAWSRDQGARVAVGLDPTVLGVDALTGVTATVVFYQYMQ